MSEQQHDSETQRRSLELARSLDVSAGDVARLAVGGASLMPWWAKALFALLAIAFVALNAWFVIGALEYRARQYQQVHDEVERRKKESAREKVDDAERWRRIEAFAVEQRGMAATLKRIERAVVR